MLSFAYEKLNLTVAEPDVPSCSWPETVASVQRDLDKSNDCFDMLQTYLTPPEPVALPGASGGEARNQPPPDGTKVEEEAPPHT